MLALVLVDRIVIFACITGGGQDRTDSDTHANKHLFVYAQLLILYCPEYIKYKFNFLIDFEIPGAVRYSPLRTSIMAQL